MRAALACALLTASLLLAGCGSVGTAPASENRRTPAAERVTPGSLVVLVPAEQDDPGLKPGVALLLDQLHRQLRATGLRVAALDTANHALLWRQEVDAVGGIYDAATGAPRPAAYAQALSALARRVCSETGCAMLLRYRLVLRTAELDGGSATWDGQRRFQPLSRTGGDSLRFTGTTRGLSVELQGIAAEGGLVFRGFGGASLPYRVDAGAGRMELRADLFDTDDQIADGVRLALAPLLGAR